MYSIVLMAAATVGPASTGWFCHGTYACSGWSCTGCGGCTGCYGCYGCAGYSGWGYTNYAGNFCVGGLGGYGHGFTVYAPVVCVGTFGCYGCYGGWSCYGVPLPHHGYWHECPPGIVVPKVPGSPNIEETPLPKELKKTTRARVIIDLPEGAALSVDGQPIKMNAGTRVFQTPDLEHGQKYYYDVRVEAERDGQKLIRNQRIILNAGETVTVAFPDLYTGASAALSAQR